MTPNDIFNESGIDVFEIPGVPYFVSDPLRKYQYARISSCDEERWIERFRRWVINEWGFIADQYAVGYGGISSSIPSSDKTIIENENRNFIQPADADSEAPQYMSDKQIGSSVITGNNTLREWTQYLEMNKTLENPVKEIVYSKPAIQKKPLIVLVVPRISRNNEEKERLPSGGKRDACRGVVRVCRGIHVAVRRDD